MMKKLCTVLMLLLMFCVPCSAAVPSEDIIIIYTNDVHCRVDDAIGYAGLKYYVDQTKAEHSFVTLVDAGDWAQGAAIGSISKGEYILEIMNAVGYDFCVPGNHEFDYTWPQFIKFTQSLDCGLYASNIKNLRTGELVLTPYKIFTYGDVKVAFVGATTPESITKTAPSYFMDENGKYIYDFASDKTGEKLAASIQKAVDDARAEGADYVIVVGHLGEYEDVVDVWAVPNIASRTRGIDAFIDGHSHETTPVLLINNLDGKAVPITQSGTKLNYIGRVTISTTGTISTELVSSSDVTGRDASITALI